MDKLAQVISKLFVIAGVVSVIIGVIVDLSGVDHWRAYPTGWFTFAIASGTLAVALKLCWGCTCSSEEHAH